MKSWHRAYVCALLASGAGLVVPVAADAQAQNNHPPQEASTGGLTEIVVTAQKREENLQQTPIAISAISARQVELRGISEIKDLSALAPNVAIAPGTTNATAAVVSIRGIPTPADETQGYDSPIGLYLDGVYLARSSTASFEVADIERVEVLRGPQGTLFGRNTTGGAINFITKLPTDDASLKLRFGYGNFNQLTGRFILNSGTIGDVLRMSIGYLHKQRDGVVNNPLQPDRLLNPGGNKTDSVRWATTLDLAHWLKITNIFDYTRVDGVASAQQLAQVGDGTFRPNVTIGGNTFSQVQPANVAGYLAEASVLQPGCGKPVQLARLNTLCLDQAKLSSDRVWGELFRVEADLGGVTLRSSTAWRGWTNRIDGSDLDGMGTLRGPAFSQASLLNGFPVGVLSLFQPAGTAAYLAGQSVPTTTQPLFQASNQRRQHQFSQELELVSGKGSAFEWVVGAFYFRENGYERNDQSFGYVLDTNQAVFTPASFGALAPILQAANPARYRLVATPSSVLGYNAYGSSKAVYGQATWRPGGADAPLGFTLGLRYTWDTKRMARFQNGPTPFTSPIDLALNDQSAKFSAPTGNFTVDYRASDEINLYARVARGYRSGGFNARQSTDAVAGIPLLPFKDEKIWSYEIGAKTEFAHRLRLNGAIFYNQYSDQLATIPIPGGATFGTQVVNAGRTNYLGAELEGQLVVTDELSLDGSVGYVHKDVKQFPAADINGVIQNIAPIITLGNSPDWTANAGATYTRPIGGGARMTARVGWNYVSSQVMFANPLTAPFQQVTAGSARGLWDAQLRIDDFDLGAAKVSITLWGKNLTNKAYVARGIDYGQLGWGGVIYGDPRTYGVTLDLNF